MRDQAGGRVRKFDLSDVQKWIRCSIERSRSVNDRNSPSCPFCSTLKAVKGFRRSKEMSKMSAGREKIVLQFFFPEVTESSDEVEE